MSSNVRRLSISNLDKWADRIYAEVDFGRSVATSLAGLLGLGIYLWLNDWTIAAFAALIFFPIARLAATAAHSRFTRRATRQSTVERARALYETLSPHEKEVVGAFIAAGGCVLTWQHMNRLDLSGSAIESLLQRGLLSTSLTADGVRETFVLEVALFDAAQKTHALDTAA